MKLKGFREFYVVSADSLNIIVNADGRWRKMFELYDDIMDVEDIMDALRLGKNSVYKLLNSGGLKGFKEFGHWKVAKTHLIEYVMKRSRGE